MRNKSSKVPVAILSCFFIAFLLQGVLKLCGVLVFERALDWQIFKIIDKYLALQIIYYSLFVVIAIYCLSFSMTAKPYSKKWYHYVIIVATAVGITVLREFVVVPIPIDIIIDVFAYVLVPFIVNITTDQNDRLLKNDIFGVVTTLTFNITLYFCQLGLQYWSVILNSMFPKYSMWLTSSSNTLIQLEVYFGLVCIMLTTNELVKYIRRNSEMLKPMNIANEEAKLKAQKAHIDKKIAKVQKREAKLQAKAQAIAKKLADLKHENAEQVKQ